MEMEMNYQKYSSKYSELSNIDTYVSKKKKEIAPKSFKIRKYYKLVKFLDDQWDKKHINQ